VGAVQDLVNHDQCVSVMAQVRESIVRNAGEAAGGSGVVGHSESSMQCLMLFGLEIGRPRFRTERVCLCPCSIDR